MSLTPRNQSTNISQRVENLSRQRANDLSALKSHLKNDLNYLQNEVNTQVSAKLTLNRRQVIHAITDLNTALKQRLGEALFAIFASFNESLKESDFESLDISRWVNSSLTLFEDRLGTLPLNQDRVLEVINEFTSTWADKVENIKNVSASKFSNQTEPSLSGHPSIPSRQPGADMSRGRDFSLGQDSRDVSDLRSSPSRTDRDDRDKSQGRGPSPSASENKGLFKKMKSLFKAEKSQAGSEGGPTNINLGNDKNFKWDPVKKRYIFEGDDEEEEPEDEGPPPMMGSGASQQPKRAVEQVNDDGGSQSLVKPPENKLLARKKAPSSKSQAEGKKPAFMPSKFVPTAAPEEEKSHAREYEFQHTGQDILEDIKRRVDEIFERTMGQEVSFEGIEKMRRDLKILDELSLPQLNDEILREAKLLALENEIESTQVSFVKESYNRKALESELSSLRQSFQQSFEKQYALDDHVKDLEKELNMYKDLYNTKNQLWSVANGNQSQQKNVENYLKSLKESSSDKKKLIETGNQIRGVELQLQEAKASIKLSEGRYEQVVEYLNKENSTAAQLRGLLEDSYKTQKEQDQMIVDLKKENLSLVSKYRGIYGEVLASQREKESLKSHLEVTEAKLNELESNLNSRVGTITELEGKLSQVSQKVRGQESQSQKKEMELKDNLKRLETLSRDKENLERRIQQEEQQRLSLETRLEELEVYREQLESRIQEEEAMRRQLEEQIREDEVFKARIRQENQEFARRVDDLIFEKESYERRLEETAEGEKRTRIQIDDYIRQLDEYQRHLNQIIEQRDQFEIENRKDREKMLEELMENKSVNQFTSQEKEMLHKFSEEISSRNLNLEHHIQALNVEINRLRSEKHRSIETILEFIREIRMTAAAESQELDSLENYIIELLESSEEASEKHFKAISILPKIREIMMREAEAEKAIKDLQSDELVTRLNTLEKEKGLYDEQNRLYEADITRLKEIIDATREQIQQFEQKINLLTNEGEQVKRENEEYVSKNFELERLLHEKDVYLKDTVQAFSDNQQYQAQIIQDLEFKFQQLATLRERTEKMQDELETEKGRNSHISGVQVELEDVINKLKEDNLDLQQQLDEGFEQYTFLQGKTKDLLEQFRQSKEENGRITQELEQLRQENEIIKSSNQNDQSANVEIIDQNQALIIENKNLTNELNSINQRLIDLQAEIGQRDAQILALEEKLILAEKSQNNDELIFRVEQVTRLAIEREDQIRELEARLVSQEQGNELAIRVEEMQQILHEREIIIAELNNRLQAQDTAINQNQAQFQEMEKIIQDGEIIIRGLEQKLALQESVQAGKVDNNDLLNKIEDLTRLLEAKDSDIKGLEALNEETLVSLRALEEEREQALKSMQQTRQERDEAVANNREIQAEQSLMIERLSLIQRERDTLAHQLEQEEAKIAQLNTLLEESKSQLTSGISTGGVPEEVVRELEARIQGLEEERINLYEDREAVIRDRENLLLTVERLEADLAEKAERTSGLPEGEELWNEIEGEYRGSKVMDYLDSMKSKLQIQRGLSAGKIVNLMLKEFEEAISELSKELEEKETTLIGLSRSLEELNEQNQKLQNNNAVLEGEQSEKEDYSSIRELYEKKTKRVEELLKEVNARNSQIEQMQKRIAHQNEIDERGNEGEKNDLKEENTLLREEIAKEKERCLKVVEEYDNYKKKYKNNDEERGAIQHSYSQIIKNLSLQLDEMKKKKGVPLATTVVKGTQTGEEEISKKPAEEDFNQPGSASGKRPGFLSGMAKFFLTESEVKKI